MNTSKPGGPPFPRIPAVLLPALLFLASCSAVQGKLLIMEGSFHFARNRNPEAIAAYLKALDFDEAAPYAEYGLGYIYLVLDEKAAALGRFAAAEEALIRLKPDTEHHELRYRIHYNTGVLRFREGDYAGAAEEFRKALEAEGSHIEAKRNLELSLLSLGPRGSAAELPLIYSEDEGREADTLFDYIHRKEQDRWKSREWAGDTPVSGPDY
ncbi:MAG: tetratricopeptide repeat protein [Spirochaetaceae bacterium]|jgi:Ca-activated chloride channel family protein|nr:tetratricopeptide repeat protein [Spirochaetaceae bacterium]